jgi:hypothetical protein
MHVLVALVVFLFVTVELLPEETVPVPLKLAFWGLSKELSFELGKVFLILLIHELEVVIDLSLVHGLEDVGW